MNPSQESLDEAVRLLEAEYGPRNYPNLASQVLATALDEAEAFKREVSDAVKQLQDTVVAPDVWMTFAKDQLARFIIPEPPVDPLVEALNATDGQPAWTKEGADKLRSNLAKRNARIVIDAPEITSKSVDDSETAETINKPDAAEVWRKAFSKWHDCGDPTAAIAVIAEALGGKA